MLDAARMKRSRSQATARKILGWSRAHPAPVAHSSRGWTLATPVEPGRGARALASRVRLGCRLGVAAPRRLPRRGSGLVRRGEGAEHGAAARGAQRVCRGRGACRWRRLGVRCPRDLPLDGGAWGGRRHARQDQRARRPHPQHAPRRRRMHRPTDHRTKGRDSACDPAADAHGVRRAAATARHHHATRLTNNPKDCPMTDITVERLGAQA